MKRLLVVLLALAACVHADRGSAPPLPPPSTQAASGFGPNAADWQAIRLSVRATPLAPAAPDLALVGQLRFRGGLELASDDARFGGLSDIYVEPNGRLLAVSDRGTWFAAQLVIDEAGALVGLADGALAPMRGENGAPLSVDADTADAEDIARLPDGRFAVSFEQTHTVRLYDLAGKGPAAPAERVIALAGADRLEANASLEAMAAFGDKLLIGAEQGRKGGGPFWIAPPAPEEAPAPAGSVDVQEGYGLVALDRLPDGDFVAMERFFAPLIGPRIYIRRVTQAGLTATPARWEGDTIADLNPPVALDNFEGLAIVAAAGKPARVYIVSDNNFSRSQKTLIYAFDLIGR